MNRSYKDKGGKERGGEGGREIGTEGGRESERSEEEREGDKEYTILF